MKLTHVHQESKYSWRKTAMNYYLPLRHRLEVTMKNLGQIWAG
jgi:hypothetical protein